MFKTVGDFVFKVVFGSPKEAKEKPETEQRVPRANGVIYLEQRGPIPLSRASSLTPGTIVRLSDIIDDRPRKTR